MSIAHQFEYIKPKTLDETIKILDDYGTEAQILAGGTDLIGSMRDELLEPEVLIDIKGIDGLAKIEFKNNTLFIGALVTFNKIIESEIIQTKFPLIMEMAKTVASSGLRNRATLVGNICSAVPSCDSGPVLLVYEADVLVRSLMGERKIPISEWFVGPKKTALKKNEIVSGVVISFPKKKHSGCYVKLGRYKGEDLAQASVAILCFSENVFRISFGAVGPIPLRAKKIEDLINGNKLEDQLIEKAKKLVPEEISPITDIRSSEEYRTHMTKVMLERGIKTASERLAGKGINYGINLI